MTSQIGLISRPCATVIVAIVVSWALAATASAQNKFDAQDYAALAAADSHATIAPGTRITLANWTEYRRFMPIGMQALFNGKYTWKIGPGPEYAMEVGPTIPIPLSAKYLADTKKYAGGVRLEKVATGGYTIRNYVAGIPFPNPAEPEMGIKLMYDVWFPYHPFVLDMPIVSITVDQFHNTANTTLDTVVWKLNHISDEGKPRSMYAPGYLEADRFEVLEPQQQKYSTQLFLQPDDPAAVQESYVFAPSMRRSLRLSTSARCASAGDSVPDDNGSGFFFQPVNFTAKMLGLKRTLAMMHLTPAGLTPDGYMVQGPLPGWPKPISGKWELRDTYIVDVTPLAAAGDYCYSHKIGYVDKETYALTWMEMYGRDSELSRVWPVYQVPRQIASGEKVLLPEAFSTTILNFKSSHATVALQDGPALIDDQAPKDLQNASVAASSSGLVQIMK